MLPVQLYQAKSDEHHRYQSRQAEASGHHVECSIKTRREVLAHEVESNACASAECYRGADEDGPREQDQADLVGPHKGNTERFPGHDVSHQEQDQCKDQSDTD